MPTRLTIFWRGHFCGAPAYSSPTLTKWRPLEGRLSTGLLLVVLCLQCIDCGRTLGVHNCADDVNEDQPSTGHLSPQEEAILKGLAGNERLLLEQRFSDARRITIRQANLFHRRFIEACMKSLPVEVHALYAGNLGYDNGRLKLRVNDEIGHPLGWDVAKRSIGLFSIWISTKETSQTLAKCNIEGRDLYVNVDSVKDNRSVDEKSTELDDQSVRDVVSRIEDKTQQSETHTSKNEQGESSTTKASDLKRVPFGSLSPDDIARTKLESEDERRITIRQANLFHYRFIDNCMEPLPDDIILQYQGILTDNGVKQGQRIEGSIGWPLGWQLLTEKDGEIGLVYTFWISTERIKQTIAKCQIEGKVIYVNADSNENNRTLDDKLPELGNRSVREVLLKIEKTHPGSEGTKK
jgi:hypothetical protein